MIVIELRRDGEVRTTERVHDPRYFHSYMADVFAYARFFGMTPSVDCEVVVTSDVRKEECELTEMIGD